MTESKSGGVHELKDPKGPKDDGPAVTEKAVSKIRVQDLREQRCGGCSVVTRLTRGATVE